MIDMLKFYVEQSKIRLYRYTKGWKMKKILQNTIFDFIFIIFITININVSISWMKIPAFTVSRIGLVMLVLLLFYVNFKERKFNKIKLPTASLDTISMKRFLSIAMFHSAQESYKDLLIKGYIFLFISGLAYATSLFTNFIFGAFFTITTATFYLLSSNNEYELCIKAFKTCESINSGATIFLNGVKVNDEQLASFLDKELDLLKKRKDE